MRITIANTEAAGGGVDHFTTDPDYQGTEIDTWEEQSYGLLVTYPNRESRLYPWASVKFVDYFMTP